MKKPGKEETPIKKKHPLHRRVKRVQIVKLEPSRLDAGAEPSTDLILLHWIPGQYESGHWTERRNII